MMQQVARAEALLFLSLLLLPLHAADVRAKPEAGLTASALQQVRGECQERCEAFFRQQQGKPFVPAKIKKNWNNRGDYTRDYNHSVLLFATRAFWLNDQAEEANRAVREMCQYHLDRPQTLLEIHSFPGVVRPLVQFARLYGPNGARAKGLLSAETYQVVLKTIWTWASAKSRIAEAELKESRSWTLYNSENHHANHVGSCWAAATFLAGQPEYCDRRFADGHTAREHCDAWTAYLCEYLRQRACKGMMVEVDSPSYCSLVLSVAYWIYDLTDDRLLKRRAGDFLSLWWALWAEQQLDGVCGGAKARCYPDSAMHGDDFIRRAAWYVLGIGDPEFEHVSMLPFITSTWHMPDVVMDLALDAAGRGCYEVRQRRLGLEQAGEKQRGVCRIRTEVGGLTRYSYCTPDFIMSALSCEARPATDWAAISSQNRWHGVIFRGATDARIYPFCESDHSSYNQQWAVQSKGSFIAQKLKTSLHADGLRVWFSKEGLSVPVKEGPWFFVEAAGAWAAVCVVSGKADFSADGGTKLGRVLKCSDDFSPVIVEVGRKADLPTFEAFRRGVLALPMTFDGTTLTYRGLGGDRFTFYADQSQLPRINGEPVDLAPAKAYDSPFVQSEWDSGVVVIQKGSKRQVLDFSDPGVP